jgi:hypothetical protein
MLDRFNGPRHVRVREFFLRGSERSAPGDLPEPCATCELVRRPSDARSTCGAGGGARVKDIERDGVVV